MADDCRRRIDALLDRSCPLQNALLAAGLSGKYEVKTAVMDAADCTAGTAWMLVWSPSARERTQQTLSPSQVANEPLYSLQFIALAQPRVIRPSD